jgi:hypothetical protein
MTCSENIFFIVTDLIYIIFSSIVIIINFKEFSVAGQIRKMIDMIVQERAKGNPLIERTTRTKLLLKGINPEKYNETSADDPLIIENLRRLALEITGRVPLI